MEKLKASGQCVRMQGLTHWVNWFHWFLESEIYRANSEPINK